MRCVPPRIPFPILYKSLNITFWSLLHFPRLCATPVCVFPQHLVCLCVSGVSRSSWACLRACPPPRGEGPVWFTCVVPALAQRSPEHLNGRSVIAVILGEIRSLELGQWDGPAQGRCHRRLFWFVFPFKDSREEVVLGSIPLPSYVISTVAPEDRISRKYSFKVLPTPTPPVQQFHPKKCCVPQNGFTKAVVSVGGWGEEVKRLSVSDSC